MTTYSRKKIIPRYMYNILGNKTAKKDNYPCHHPSKNIGGYVLIISSCLFSHILPNQFGPSLSIKQRLPFLL